MAAQYHFLSRYSFEGDPGRVWDAIASVESWPRWWSWLQKVDVVRAGGDGGLGAVYRFTVRAPAGYGFVYETENVGAEPLHHIGIGREHARTHVIVLVADLDIRIVNAATGELLRHLTLDPTRNYQPTGEPRSQKRQNPRT